MKPSAGAWSSSSNRWVNRRAAASAMQRHVAGAVGLGGEVVGAAVIGVQLLHQPAMRRPDRLGVGAGSEPEDRIGFLDRDVGTAGRGARFAAPAGEILLPVGVGAVE